jgi:hypothetical protein
MLNRNLIRACVIVVVALTLLACGAPARAGVVVAAEQRPPANDDLQQLPGSALPNGVIETCKVVQRDADPGDGTRVMALTGGRGAFIIVLPEAADWAFQCDKEELFWAFSRSKRTQVTVMAHRPNADEDTTPRNYLGATAAKFTSGLEANGVRVTNPAFVSLTKRADGETIGLQMTLNAPAGQTMPLFPQDSFFISQRGPGGFMFDAYYTTYFRNADEQASMRSTMRAMMAGFRAIAAPASP